jgi:hypothetical protein
MVKNRQKGITKVYQNDKKDVDTRERAPSLAMYLVEERKFPSSPATAKITKVGLQLHFGWAHAHPGNRLTA